MNRKKIIILGITTVFLLIITVIGFAYGYYSSFVRKIDQSKKITVTSGNSQITYIASLKEDETIQTIKPGFSSVDYFAVQNTGNLSAMYFIYLENVINTFINTEDVTYSIYRTKGTDNINFDFIDIDTLDYTSWDLLIDNEIFPTKDSLLKEKKETITSKDEYYIYAIIINYKYRLDKDQSIDSDHIFGGQVKLIPTDNIDTDNIYEKGTLAHEIINNTILNLNGTKYSTKSIESLMTDTTNESILSVTEDNYGLSYYFRGNVIDNFVNFNNMCWKVVRIEGDGSIKLSLYDSNSICNNIKTNNSPLIKNEDVIITTGFENIKTELNNWYNLNKFSKLESKLKNNTWCITNTDNKYNIIDNSLIENLDIYEVENKNEEGYYSYNYNVKKRINENLPTLKCEEANNLSESYIGLITAEELIYNHNNAGINNKGYNIATSSLSKYESKDNLNYIYTYSLNELPATTDFALNPIIVLNSGIKYIKGNGTINNPYEIN